MIFIAKYFNIPYNFLTKNGHDSDKKIRVLLFSYIQYNLTSASKVNASFKDIMYHVGLSNKQRAKDSPKLKEVITALYEFEEEGYILLPDKPIENMNFHEMFTMEVMYGGIEIVGYKDDGGYILGERFVKISIHEYENIIFEHHSLTNPTDLFIFAYIKAHIFNRGKSQTIEDRAEAWQFSHNELSTAAGIDVSTVRNAVKRLDSDMHLIKYSHPKSIQRGYKDGKVKVLKDNYFNLKTVYVLNKDGWEDELAWGMKKYRNDSYNKFGEIEQ